MCGGSLLSSETVLIAAHCVAPPNLLTNLPIYLSKENMSVVVGDLTQSIEEGTEQILQVKDISIHPDYYKNEKNPVDKDFAIIKLATEVKFTNYVNPICLPPKTKNFDSVEAKASGWGRTSGNAADWEGSKSDILQKVSKSFGSP